MPNWMFEVAATAQPMGWDDPAIGHANLDPWVAETVFDISEDLGWMDDGKSAPTAFDVMLSGAPEDEDATPIDDIDVIHPRDNDDDRWWDDPNTGGDGPSDGGDSGLVPDDGSGAAIVIHLPNDLTTRDCEDLAFWEREREEKIQSGRGFAVAGLSATGDYFQGQKAYQEIYDSFARLDAAGGFDRNDAFANVWHVFNDVREASGLVALTLRTIGIGIAAEFAILSAVQGVYIAQKELDRINAEQARRGGRCG